MTTILLRHIHYLGSRYIWHDDYVVGRTLLRGWAILHWAAQTGSLDPSGPDGPNGDGRAKANQFCAVQMGSHNLDSKGLVLTDSVPDPDEDLEVSQRYLWCHAPAM